MKVYARARSLSAPFYSSAFERELPSRRFPPPWSVEDWLKSARLASGYRYKFQILSAVSPTAVFKDIVFDELARIFSPTMCGVPTGTIVGAVGLEEKAR